jgi:renalase
MVKHMTTSDATTPTPHHTTPDVLIVGAGLCGLMAATVLATGGQRVTVLDKAPSVGGRLATRRIGPGRADHGAQFFTVRNTEFATWVQRWIDAGLVYRWSTGWSDGSLAESRGDGHPRYAVLGGMNALAKHLAAQAIAAGAHILTSTRASAASITQHGWQVLTEQGQELTSRQLLLTSPVPQSLALLDAGQTALAADERAALERIRYAPCLVGLFWVEGEVLLPEPGALQQPDAPIAWITDNQRKGISPDARLITMHAGPEWSAAHYDAGDEQLVAEFAEVLQPFLSQGSQVRDAQIKRWRYSQPTVLHPAPFLQAETLHPLYFGGDAFGSPRIEGAALSGLAIAGHLRNRNTLL